MLPRTAVMCAPDRAFDQLGTGMPSSDLICGLKLLNSRVVIPLPEHYAEWYPGKRAGQTCIWLGPPGHPKSSKICAFHLGMIPEWTQIAPGAVMIARGWRSILDLCIRRRVASKAAIERVFRVNMDVGGKDTLCRICRKDGLRSPVDGKADVCEAHRNAQMDLAVSRERKKEHAWNREHPSPPRRGPYVFHHRRTKNAAQAQSR
jgi:hypothetical protein